MASAFLIQVFAFGLSTSIGVYNIEFLDYFDNDTVGVSLIAAMNWAMFLGAGKNISAWPPAFISFFVLLFPSSLFRGGGGSSWNIYHAKNYLIFITVRAGLYSSEIADVLCRVSHQTLVVPQLHIY